MNPFTYEGDADVAQDEENRQRQIEADRILALRMQQQEYGQQHHPSDSLNDQRSLTELDEELAVCLLASDLHQQEGLTRQSEPIQDFSRATCSSAGVTNMTELNDVIANRLLASAPSRARLQSNTYSSTSTRTDILGDQQALQQALSLSLLETQHHLHGDLSSDQQALDEAMALSLSSLQHHDRNGNTRQQYLDAAIARSLSIPQAFGQPRGPGLNENFEYEDLLELEDLIGSAEATRLSSNQVQMLPTYKYQERPHFKSGAVDERRESCAICLEMFESGSDVKSLPCLHIFHQACIDQWLQTKAVCPTCNIRVEL